MEENIPQNILQDNAAGVAKHYSDRNNIGGVEYANNPDLVPDRKWKKWTINNLPSKDLWVSDIDSMIRSYNGCFILIEIKRKNKPVPFWQKLTYGVLATLLQGAEGHTFDANEYLAIPMEVKHFCGFAKIRFEKTWFDDGKVYLNDVLSTEEKIIHYLSFGEYCQECFPKECKGCQEHCNAIQSVNSDHIVTP